MLTVKFSWRLLYALASISAIILIAVRLSQTSKQSPRIQPPSIQQPSIQPPKLPRKFQSQSLPPTLLPFRVVDLTREPKSNSIPCVNTKTDPVFTICIHSHVEAISTTIRDDKLWEDHVRILLSKILHFYPEATFIDAGANIGYFTMYVASVNHDVIAIEPTRDHIAPFHKSVALNKVSNKIVLLNNALLDRHTTVTMFAPDSRNMGNFFAMESRPNESTTLAVNKGRWSIRGDYAVPAVTLDDVATLVKSKVVIMKIDIEGRECQAFNQSDYLFRHVYVPYIIIEWMFVSHSTHGGAGQCTVEDSLKLVRVLEAKGYTAYDAKTLKKIDVTQNIELQRSTYDLLWIHVDARKL